MESEYAQLKLNMEKEVELRMGFEGMLNGLRTKHKNLEIKYERGKVNLNKAKMRLRKTEEHL